MTEKLRKLLPYARRRWRLLITILGLTIVSSVMTVVLPWPMKILVDYGLGNEPLPSWLLGLLPADSAGERPRLAIILLAAAATFAIFAINAALTVALSFAWMATGQRMVYELAADLFGRLQRLSLQFHARSSVGDFLDRLSADTWCVYSIISDVGVGPVQQSFTLITIGLVAWQLDPFLTVVTMTAVPVLAGSVYFFGPWLKRRAKKGREAQSQLTQFVHQTLSAIPLVQAFGTEQWNQQRFGRLVDNAVQVAQQGTLLNKSFGLVSGLATTIALAAVLFLGGQRVLSGTISIGTLVIFLAYVRTLQQASTKLLQTYAKLKTTEASLERVFEIMDSQDEVFESAFASDLPATTSAAHIIFDDVSTGYDEGRPVLNQISTELFPGEKIAIVGETGAGKTTFVSLIPRLHDVWEGRVRFNGLDVRDLTLDSLRSQITIVPQDPFLLPVSVADNIAYANPRATREQIIAAATAAQAHAFIEKLPQGYDTIVGQRGATFSGGEKQRLAIARALVRPASLVILDEPTSALDAETEQAFMEAMDLLRSHATVIVIAHRLSTVRNADRILVLERGCLVESGSPQELLERRGTYFSFTSGLGPGVPQEVEA